MTTDDGVLLVLTTTGDEVSARALALALVEERLAACVTRTGVRSVFRWSAGDGDDAEAAKKPPEVIEEEEVLLIIKTAASRREELGRRLKELHPYDCPEIVFVSASGADPDYQAWLLGACGGNV